MFMLVKDGLDADGLHPVTARLDRLADDEVHEEATRLWDAALAAGRDPRFDPDYLAALVVEAYREGLRNGATIAFT